ncbi:MAG: glycerol-3-phosphate acyltransferase [Dehalococcoidia bacterium]|nr:glycerol-3-phosphate acyltransferase [Dehalococcoidia bacterium]
MDICLITIVAIVISYLLGSIPSAYIIGRLFKGIDIRKTGSGNMGAMNAIYAVGLVPGLIVGAADVGKGALAVYLGTLLCQLANPPALALMIVQMVCGLAAIGGHNYPVFLGFRRGGKGGATAIGVLFYMVPMGILFFILLLLIVLAITRYLTISYGIAFVAFPIVICVQWVTPVDAWLQATLPAMAWMRSRAADTAQYTMLIMYSIVLILIPVLMYIPRIKEILSKSGGSFKKAAFHSSVKDRP